MSDPVSDYQAAVRVYSEARRALQDKLHALGYEDVTPDRAMILLAIAEREQPLTRLEGVAYLGTNISYNASRLTDGGYAVTSASSVDRRVRILRITPKGAAVVQSLTGKPVVAANPTHATEVAHVA